MKRLITIIKEKSIILTALTVLSSLVLCNVGAKISYASSLDLREQYEEAKEEAEANDTTARKLAAQVREMNLRLIEDANVLENLNKELVALDEQVEYAERRLIEYEEDLASEKDFLYRNIRMTYESRSGKSLLSRFLESDSVLDFLNKQEYSNTISAYFEDRMAGYEVLNELFIKQKENLDELKTAKEEEIIEIERKRSKFNESVAELSTVMKEARKKAEDSHRFATELAAQVAVMEAEERALLEKRNNEIHNSNVIYTGNGTDYYYETARDFSDTELVLMAGIIQAEAGSTSYPGMIAVGSVVMNRVASPSFPGTIEGVIYAEGQFEPVRTGRLAMILADGPAQSCVEAARDVLNGKRNVPNFYFKADWYAKEHNIEGIEIGGNVFH